GSRRTGRRPGRLPHVVARRSDEPHRLQRGLRTAEVPTGSCPMTERPPRLLRIARRALALALAAAGAGSVCEGAAFAQDPDGFAKHALSRARGYYRAGDYDHGADLLEEASNACGADGCSPSLKAAVLRERGAMEFKRGNEVMVPQLFAEARAL